MPDTKLLSIGQLSARTGLSVSAIRFYETKELVTPIRNAGGQRRFARAEIRRLAFVQIAQRLGFPLTDIQRELAALPRGRAPTKADWARISDGFRTVLDARIETLTRMRDRLDGCIGCGCLSLESCELYNPGDRAARLGSGPRYVLGDKDKPPDNPSD